MSLQTHVARCGACAGLMVFKVRRDLHGVDYAFFYACAVCWTITPERSTAAEAALDVVWVPIDPAASRKGKRNDT